MVGRLLGRGILAGIFASMIAFCFAKIFGEPQVAQSIAFETAQSIARGGAPEPELVSRSVQASWGLFVAIIMCGASYGGIFSIIFALSYQRLNHLGPKGLSLLVAGLGFLTFVLIPGIKYPPNPPAVGLEETIGYRTAMYFIMVALSICMVMISTLLARSFSEQYGSWNGVLLGIACGCIVLFASVHFMPTINEVPKAFPATILWDFREAAIGTQFILWSLMGIIFGYLANHLFQKKSYHY